MSRYLLLLVALLPMAVFGANVDLERDSGADVASDEASYVAVNVHAPDLHTGNNWQDEALTVTHNHAPGTTLEVDAVLIDDQGRFSIPDAQAVLSESESHVLEIADSDHSTGTFTVTFKVTIEFRDQGSVGVGEGVMERTVQVVVS